MPSAGTDQELQQRLTLERYPLSAKYPARWVVDNLMGPNPLWLAEALAEVMPLEPGARVLDMGCGTALTSIFLAREFGVQVWATDLWVKPTENAARIAAQGLEDRVFPIAAEARALPYADGFFDAAVSYDAYHYFGTDDLYIGYYSRFVKPGGAIGFVVPGMSTELAALPPPELADHWPWDFCAFHSPAWWRRTLENSGLVTAPSDSDYKRGAAGVLAFRCSRRTCEAMVSQRGVSDSSERPGAGAEDPSSSPQSSWCTRAGNADAEWSYGRAVSPRPVPGYRAAAGR